MELRCSKRLDGTGSDGEIGGDEKHRLCEEGTQGKDRMSRSFLGGGF